MSKIGKDEFIVLLKECINQIEDLKEQEIWSNEFKKWKNIIESSLERKFGKNSSQLEKFKKIRFGPIANTESTTEREYKKAYIEGLDDAKALLESTITELEIFGDFDPLIKQIEEKEDIDIKTKEELKNRIKDLEKELKRDVQDKGKIQKIIKYFKEHAPWIIPPLMAILNWYLK